MKSNLLGAGLLALALPLAAVAGVPVDIEVLDRKSGRVLPVYWHDGERHIAGEPGREYEIRLRNRGECRVLAVTAVDGVPMQVPDGRPPAIAHRDLSALSPDDRDREVERLVHAFPGDGLYRPGSGLQ